MLKIHFTNASVKDDGYGLCVNGKELKDIISTALGTRVGNIYGIGSGLPYYRHGCCDVTVIINPKPVTEEIETSEEVWNSVQEMEECLSEQYKERDCKEKG